MNPFIGQILMFGGNFAPRGWAFCDGQLLPISQNTALFSILGTIYGGDGRTTFALPDMRGRLVAHAGNGPGLRDYRLGAKFGTETNTMNILTMPSHNHTAIVGGNVSIHVSNALADEASADGNVLSETSPLNIYSGNGASGTEKLDGVVNQITTSVGQTGNSQSINNLMPALAINYIIALVGTFPSRS